MVTTGFGAFDERVYQDEAGECRQAQTHLGCKFNAITLHLTHVCRSAPMVSSQARSAVGTKPERVRDGAELTLESPQHPRGHAHPAEHHLVEPWRVQDRQHLARKVIRVVGVPVVLDRLGVLEPDCPKCASDEGNALRAVEREEEAAGVVGDGTSRS